MFRQQETLPTEVDQRNTGVDAANKMLRNLEAGTSDKTTSTTVDLTTTDISNRDRHGSVAITEITRIVDLAFELQHEKQEQAQEAREKEIAASVKQRMEELAGTSKGTVSYQAMIDHLGQMGIDTDVATKAVESTGYVAKYEAKRQSLAQELGLPDDASPKRIRYEQYLRKSVDACLPTLVSTLNEIANNPLSYPQRSVKISELYLLEDSYTTAFKKSFVFGRTVFSKPTSPALNDLIQKAYERGAEILIEPSYSGTMYGSDKLHNISIILKLRS